MWQGAEGQFLSSEAPGASVQDTSWNKGRPPIPGSHQSFSGRCSWPCYGPHWFLCWAAFQHGTASTDVAVLYMVLTCNRCTRWWTASEMGVEAALVQVSPGRRYRCSRSHWKASLSAEDYYHPFLLASCGTHSNGSHTTDFILHLLIFLYKCPRTTFCLSSASLRTKVPKHHSEHTVAAHRNV